LNDAKRILFKRSKIALAKHSNIEHFSHLYVKHIYIKQKKLGWCELIFAGKFFWKRKSIPTKFGKHHRDNCCSLFIIRNCSIGPYGVFWRSHWGGTHGTKLKNFRT